MRILIICPIPIEYTSCRNVMSLRDRSAISGCRAAHGSVSGVEITAVEAGPAKARAAAATAAGIHECGPGFVVDSGCCAALDSGLIVGTILAATSCIEYDISGKGLPEQVLPDMRLPSALDFLERGPREKIVRAALGAGGSLGLQARSGIQACGELLVYSRDFRDALHARTGAAACNWETAGVFVAALRAAVPPLSFRAVTDLGDENARGDFRRNARNAASGLYRHLLALLDSGWFSGLADVWGRTVKDPGENLPKAVLPSGGK